MKCTQCGKQLGHSERFCGECGAPRSHLSPRFAQAEQQFTVLRGRHQAGEIDDATFETELEKLLVVDEQGTQWILGANGDWFCFQDQKWVKREPPTVAPKPESVTPPVAAPKPEVTPTLAEAAPPAVKPKPRNRQRLGCMLLLAMTGMLVVAGVLATLITPTAGWPCTRLK